MAFTIDLVIPVPDLSTEIAVNIPFSVNFPTTVDSGRSSSGRSLSTSSLPPRATMYKYIEKYIGQITGSNGHNCLLRAMCEASATPNHDEGLLGDAVNFILTSSYAEEEQDIKFKEYFKAQSKGQVYVKSLHFKMIMFMISD